MFGVILVIVVILAIVVGAWYGRTTIRLVSRDTCGWCRRFQPVWDEVSAELGGVRYRFVTITEADLTAEEKKISGVPRVYRAGPLWGLFGRSDLLMGATDAATLRSFVTRRTINGETVGVDRPVVRDAPGPQPHRPVQDQ